MKRNDFCHRRRLGVTLSAIALLLLAPAAYADLLVFGASSLRDALTEVVSVFEDKTGIDVTTSYASSGTLA